MLDLKYYDWLIKQDEYSEVDVEFYLNLAHRQIQNYLNYPDNYMFDDKGKPKFVFEVQMYAKHLIDQKGLGNVKSKKQGDRTETYGNYDEIPKHIVDMLPIPLISTIL